MNSTMSSSTSYSYSYGTATPSFAPTAGSDASSYSYSYYVPHDDDERDFSYSYAAPSAASTAAPTAAPTAVPAPAPGTSPLPTLVPTASGSDSGTIFGYFVLIVMVVAIILWIIGHAHRRYVLQGGPQSEGYNPLMNEGLNASVGSQSISVSVDGSAWVPPGQRPRRSMSDHCVTLRYSFMTCMDAIFVALLGAIIWTRNTCAAGIRRARG